MLKKSITYVDYNGVERTEDFYFNLSKAEVMEMELTTVGGLSEQIKKVVNTDDRGAIIKIFKNLVLQAYGVKSDDGKRFIKNDYVKQSFYETEAYSNMFMELATNDAAASEFVNGIIPKVEAK